MSRKKSFKSQECSLKVSGLNETDRCCVYWSPPAFVWVSLWVQWGADDQDCWTLHNSCFLYTCRIFEPAVHRIFPMYGYLAERSLVIWLGLSSKFPSEKNPRNTLEMVSLLRRKRCSWSYHIVGVESKNVSYIDFWPSMTPCLCGW
jgi:hypothetical protein